MPKPQFNVRVYAIIQKENQFLLSHEWNDEVDFWKFPGGGVEMDEGVLDALKREIGEELSTSIDSKSLFYVNEHYQKSLFGNEALLAFYYLVQVSNPDLSSKKEKKWGKDYHMEFVWASLQELQELLHFPLDRKVLGKLSQ